MSQVATSPASAASVAVLASGTSVVIPAGPGSEGPEGPIEASGTPSVSMTDVGPPALGEVPASPAAGVSGLLGSVGVEPGASPISAGLTLEEAVG
jgi:hypothetical protein